MENLDLGLNLGFINDENLDKLLVTLTLLENGINSLNSTDDTVNIFSAMLRKAVILKQELKDIKEIYDDINKSDSKKSAGGNTSKDKEGLNSSIIDLTQQIKNLVEIYKSTQNDRRKGKSDNTGSTGTGRGVRQYHENDTELDRINNELRQNAKAYRKDYSNKRNLNTTDIFRKLSEDNVRALKEQLNMFEGLTKEVVNKLSDTNFNNIITNGFIKKIQEISSKTVSSDNYYSSVNKLVSDISKQIGSDDFKNLSKIRNAIRQEELNVYENKVRVKNYENKRKYGKEDIDTTFFNSVKDFSKALKDSESEIKLYKRKLYEGKLNDNNLQNDLKRLKNRNNYSFNDKVDFEKRLNNYFQQNATKINNQGSYIDNLRQTASTVFFTKEMLGYIGNISQFNEAKEFERNMTSLGVSGGFNSKGAVNSEKSTLMQMTEKTGTNVNEMASSLREVIKTGRGYNQSVELVKNATLLASTSFEDVSTSIDILNSKLLALDMNIDSASIKRISNKIYNVLDNTALDLRDIANAGKQTNPILNSMVDSAENKGRLQNKTVDEYKEQLIDVEQSFIGELRQQGKTGEQAGTVIRNLFTKMMSIDGIAGKMLDRDLMKVSEEKLNKAGFKNAKELSDLWQSGDIEKALNGLSMLVSEGDITFATIKKMVTERHSSSVVSVFNKINGDLETFIKNMTEGKDLTEKNTQAMDNWSTSVDRLVNSLKNIGIASLTKGTNGAIFGGLTGVANLISGFNENILNSDNPIIRGFGLAVPQGIQQGILMRGVSTQTRKFGVGNVNEAFKMAQGRITDPEKLKEMIEVRNTTLAQLSENKGFKGFVKNLDLASRSTEELADNLVTMSEKGNLSFDNLKVGSSGLLSTLGSVLKPTLYMMAINFVINSAIEYYNSLKKVQEELDNLDESISKTAELGTSIENLRTNIDILTKVETFNQKEFNYSKFIDNMISSNDKLKESFEALNNIKNTTFKSFSDIRQEMFEKYTKKEDINTSSAVYQTGRFSLKMDKYMIDNQKLNDLNPYNDNVLVYYLKEGNDLSLTGRTTRNIISQLQGEIYNEKSKKYESVKNDNIYNFNKDKRLQQIVSGILASGKFDYEVGGYDLINALKTNGNFKNLDLGKDGRGNKITLDNVNKIDTSLVYNRLMGSFNIKNEKLLKEYEKKFDAYVSGLSTSAESRIGTDKYSKLDDNSKIKEMLKEGGGKLPEFIVRATLKNQDLAKEIGEVNDLEEFNKYLNGFEGNTLEEKYQNMVQTIVSTSQNKQTMDYAISWAREGFNALKQSYEEYYKQLDTFRQYRDSIIEQINQSKQNIREIFMNKGMRNVVAEDMFTERRNAKNELISLDKSGLSKYNNQFRKEVASIDSGTIQNNPQAFMNFQASLKHNLNGQSELEYQIKQAETELDKEKKKGIQEDIKMAEDKVNYLKQSKKLLEDEVPVIKQQLAMAQFNIKTLKELAEISAQVQSKQAEIRNQVGVAFGNRGSSMQLAYEVLNAQRNTFNTYGKMGLQTQINSALTFDAGGKFLKEMTGKSNYANVDMGDYLKVQKQIEEYNKQVANTDMSKLSDDEKKKLQEKADNLQRTGGIISSVLGETMALEEKRLEFAQREKQLNIDIVKYWLERNKLIANFTESAETKQSDIDIKSANINYTMKYGNGKYGSIEELQRVTNLKLENSNLKMKDQLDYAKRQIMVAKENSTRQINAIRRLENKNTNNSQKSDTQAKQNSNETNKTIVDSANNISNNLNNALNQIMATIQTMQTSYSPYDGTYSNTPIGSMSNISGFDYKSLSPIKGSGYNNVLPLATEISQKLRGQVSPEHLMKVFGLESDWKQGDVTGSYRGLGQWSHKEWNTWVNYVNGERFGLQKGSPDDPRANALMTALMIIHNADKLRQRGHTNVTPEDIHLSHLFTSYLYGNYTDSNKVTDIKGVTAEMIMKNPSITKKNMNITIGEAKNNIRNIYASKLKGKTPQVIQSIGSSGLVFDKNPIGVDPNLVRLLQDAHSMAKKQGIDFKVPSSGVWRDSAEQNTYFKQGGSKADGYKKLSRHQRGQALDIHILKGGEKAYGEVNKIVQQLANQRGMKIEWGGSWKGFYDPYHFQVNNSQWDSHKNPNLRTQGGTTLQIQNITLPKAYIPKLDKVTQEDIEKITNYEIYKDQIKTEKDEQMLNELASLLKSLEGETYNVSIAKLTEKKNAIKNIQTPDETYDVSLNVIEQAISNFESKLETGLENLSKLQQNFIETLTELQFSFRELKNVVNSTNVEYTNAFNFLEQVSFTDRFNEFMFKIEETQVKLEQYNKKLALETNYNNNVRQNLFGLLGKHNINLENNPLETGEDMKKFLSNREQMLDVMSIVEDMIGESISKNFDTLEFDKSSLKNISNEEIDKMKYEMATKLAEKESEGQKLIFGSSAELTNLFETLKLLKSQIEKTNEVRKTEIDLIKQNTKYLSEYSKNISNMLKEVNLTDNSKARSVRTLLFENNLINRGISLESNYAKNYINRVNVRNKYEEYQEEMYNFNRSLKYDSSLRNILKNGGYSDDYLNNYDLNNMNYNDISNMANVILDYQDRARYTIQQELNNLVNKFSLTDKFKDVDLTDMTVIRSLNAETLANETGNSVENMKEFLNGVNIVKNSVHNTDNILETLTKVLNANKTAHEESAKMYQELYKQGLNLLSDMLFGDSDFKGLSSEQYTQALDSLLQFGINSFGSVSNSFKGLFGKDKGIANNATTSNTKVALDNNKVTSGNILDTDNLLETINKSNIKLIDKFRNQDLIVSSDKGLLILPEELKRGINKNLETKSLFSFETPNNFDFGKKVEESIVKEPQLFNTVSQSLLSHYIKDNKPFKTDDITYYYVSDKIDTLPLEIFDNKELRDKILNNDSDVNSQLSLDNNKQKKKSTYNDITNLTLNSIVVIDGFMKKQMQYKKQELELQGKILEMNLQMAETSEERRRIEEQILQNKLAQVDNEYNTNSSFMGGAIKGSAGFGIQGALSGAMTGMSLGGGVGAIVGAGLGLVGGLFGSSNAKIQAEQQKAQLIAQQKLQWLAEDRNKYLKTMASAMSEQAKWTAKIGVNDAISRSVKAVISSVDTIGGTASDTKTIQKKKKKSGGLLGSKKYDTVQAFTASYNTNDSMFGGRVFDDRTDLDFAYGVLTKRILGDKVFNNSGNQSLIQSSLLSNSLTQLIRKNRFNNNYFQYSNIKYKFKDRRKNNISNNTNNDSINNIDVDNYTGSLAEYLDKKIATSGLELTSGQFLNAFWGRDTLKNMGLLQDTSRDWEISALINSMKAQYSKMGASQEKVDMLALINFYENIQALLDKEGKTTKRLFGNYYGIETEEVKDEKGNITEYRRVNESMWSDLYQQQFQNIMNGTNGYDIGTKFIQGTLNAFIQNVSSGRNTVKAVTDEFNRLADEIYNVVTRTGEFSNVSASIKGLIDNMATLKKQQRETENFTIELAKKWVSLGGNITDIVKDMNNGLSLTIENIKSTMLGDSLENTINNLGNSLFQRLGESMTTNLINKKYANDIFKMNGLLTNATDSNSISDIVSLANGYKGLSTRIESDRERLSAIQRLFTANRDIDYVDESIQYETGTSQSITNNYTFTTDINAGTIVADELSQELLARSLFAPLVQMLRDNGFIH